MVRSFLFCTIDTVHFAKPSPPQTATKGPSEKIQSPPARKHPKENVLPEARKTADKAQPAERPVIPPPPVISKPLSPDYLGFADHSVNTGPEPLRSFSGLIEPAKTSYPKVDPVGPAYVDVNRPNISNGVQNIKPIPSIVPPVISQVMIFLLRNLSASLSINVYSYFSPCYPLRLMYLQFLLTKTLTSQVYNKSQNICTNFQTFNHCMTLTYRRYAYWCGISLNSILFVEHYHPLLLHVAHSVQLIWSFCPNSLWE